MPAIFYDFFRYNCHIHDHDTRTANHLHAPSTISNLSKSDIRYEGGIIWNKILSGNINPDSSEQSFKVIWKNCIIQRLITNEFISNWLMIKWRLLLLSCSLPFIAIFINSLHVYLIILVAPVLTELVISCYQCTYFTVMGPINLWSFLPPFAILLYICRIHVIIIFSIVLKLRTESCHIDCIMFNGGVGNIDGPYNAVGGSWVWVMAAHYSDGIMCAMASRTTSLTVDYSTIYSGADQRKHKSSTSLAVVRRNHRWPVNSPHKCPVTRKMFPFDDVIMSRFPVFPLAVSKIVCSK